MEELRHMPRRFVGSRVFGASSGDHLFIDVDEPDFVTVTYQHEKAKRKLLEISGPKDYLSIYPLNTLPTHPDFLKPKYEKIECITLEGFDFEIPTSVADVRDVLEQLPSGFVKDTDYGLGLVKDYRFIIDAIERIRQIKHLVISRKSEAGISEELYTLSFKDYDSIRRGINRITSRQ